MVQDTNRPRWGPYPPLKTKLSAASMQCTALRAGYEQVQVCQRDGSIFALYYFRYGRRVPKCHRKMGIPSTGRGIIKDRHRPNRERRCGRWETWDHRLNCSESQRLKVRQARPGRLWEMMAKLTGSHHARYQRGWLGMVFVQRGTAP